MNLEAIDLYKQAKYLNKELQGAGISKIFMPTPNALLITFRAAGCSKNLLCDLGGNGPALYIPEQIPENPNTPPAFCMLLRKHFEEGRIAEISQRKFDRVIGITVDLLANGGKIITKELIFELGGRNSNIIFVQDGRIVDCLRHVNAAQNRIRTLLPGQTYTPPPPQSGLHPLAVAPTALSSAIINNSAPTLQKKIIAALSGIGNRTAERLLKTADTRPDTATAELPPADRQNLQNRLTLALTALRQEYLQPADDTLNKHIIAQMRTAPIRLAKQDLLSSLVKGEIKKTTRRLQALQTDLLHAENAEEQRIIADTLMANLYRIPKGAVDCRLNSIYDGQILNITLNPALSPNANAQNYYKRYNKYKRAQSELERQISRAQTNLVYLEGLATALTTVDTRSEVEEIAEELTAAGLIKAGKKRIPSRPSQPLKIVLSDGEIYVGKNNRQNELVTFKIAGPDDLWFHTKDIPGSHVILKGTATEANIRLAQMLAAHFSKASSGSNIPVDTVQKKFVKKPHGAPPGFVIFTNNRTAYINIDSETIKKALS